MPQTGNRPFAFSSRYNYIRGKDAWRNNLRLTALAADRTRSSLGPNGAYKMVTYNRGPEKIVKITKDALPVLEELAIEYPTLTVLAEAAKMHRQQVGDGATSLIILVASLLKKADELIAKNVHPTVVLDGYIEAAREALEIITAASETLCDNISQLMIEQVDCGRTYLTEQLTKMIIEASEVATKNGKLDKDRICIIRKPGETFLDTKFIKGLIIKKNKLHPNMPDAVEKPTIAITSQRIGINRLEIKMPGQGPFQMKFNIEKGNDLKACKDAEKQQKLEALERLYECGSNVLFSQQPIDDYSKGKLVEMGILAFENVDRTDLELISKATNAKIIGPLFEIELKDVGRADYLELDKIRLEKIVTLTGCDFATFIIQGSTLQTLDELESFITKSLSLLQTATVSKDFVFGGGAIETHIARRLKSLALMFPGRKQLAVNSFGEALLEIPRSLATNNGLFADDVLADLNKLHSEGLYSCGISTEGCCNKVCVELSEVKRATIKRAIEVVSLMLRIDEQITAKEIPKFHKQ